MESYEGGPSNKKKRKSHYGDSNESEQSQSL